MASNGIYLATYSLNYLIFITYLLSWLLAGKSDAMFVLEPGTQGKLYERYTTKTMSLQISRNFMNDDEGKLELPNEYC